MSENQEAILGERQGHGFKYEQRVVAQNDITYFGKHYTHVWDAATKEETPRGISIKTKRIRQCVELGSFKRNQEKTEDYFLVVGFWDKKKENIVKEHILLIPGKVWATFFPKDCDEDIRLLLEKSLPTREYDATWKKECKELHKKWNALGSIIRLAPKRDHNEEKPQRRMQCVIPYKHFLKLIELYEVESLPQGSVAL